MVYTIDLKLYQKTRCAVNKIPKDDKVFSEYVMLQDPETLENIVTASSSLDNDPVAIELKLVFWVIGLKMTKLQ